MGREVDGSEIQIVIQAAAGGEKAVQSRLAQFLADKKTGAFQSPDRRVRDAYKKSIAFSDKHIGAIKGERAGHVAVMSTYGADRAAHISDLSAKLSIAIAGRKQMSDSMPSLIKIVAEEAASIVKHGSIALAHDAKDAVVQAAVKTYEALEKAVRTTASAIVKIVRKGVDVTKKVGAAIKGFAVAAGKIITSLGKAVGRGATKGAKATVRGVKTATAEALQPLAHGVTRVGTGIADTADKLRREGRSR